MEGVLIYSKSISTPYFLRFLERIFVLTIEEYAKSNYKFLNRLQAMLFISHNVEMKGVYVSHDKKSGQYNLVYVFEKNKENEELLNKFRNYELDWGDNVLEFEFSPTLIEK